VLLRLRADAPALPPSLAPGLRELGVMLPYTPLHELLLAAVGGPLVMTSGNASDEPIAMANAEALDRLETLADLFLLHDRDIYSRYDDSVARVTSGRTELVRRARGYAPFPVRLPHAAPVPLLATGSEQKNTFCLASGRYAFVSQHVGDMENAETLEHYERTLALYERLFRVTPQLVAYDLHPEYLASKFALSLGLPAEGVQHHHAHIAAVAAENGIDEPVVGLAFDGTGYGTDGTIWGGEVLIADARGFERFAHLRPMPMPGGAAAIRRPARMALGLLTMMGEGLLAEPGAARLQSALTTDELAILPAMVSRSVNSPFTSSIGRLFDAVASLAGVRHDAFYEGQAAIELEALADPAETGSYPFALTGDAPVVIDPLPMIESLLADVAACLSTPRIAARFHNGLADVSVAIARRAAQQRGLHHVALGGGVFLNRLLVRRITAGLEAGGLTVLLPRELPVSDGAISFGQAVVGRARLDAVQT
jgi:hydrogenase maturation protein HypF